MTKGNMRSKVVAFTTAAFATLFAGSALADGIVNIYSYRQPDIIKPVLDAFTAETGIKTEVLFLDKGLEDRILAEGHQLARRRHPDGRHCAPDQRQGQGRDAGRSMTRPSTPTCPPNIATRRATGSA